MKQTFILFVLLISWLCPPLYAQAENQAKALKQQAEESLAKKEYTQARSLFLKAYQAYANKGDYTQAAECGIQTCNLYHRENLYKEAFDILRQTESMVIIGERKSGKRLPKPLFNIYKERLQMYTKLQKTARAKEQIERLEATAQRAANDSLNNELLYTKASFYYTFGMTAQGDQAITQLIGQYTAQKNYSKVKDCYQTLLNIARKANQAALMERTYRQYMAWNDSIQALTAQDKLNALKQRYDESLQTIQDKDHSLNSKQYIIIGLCLLAAILTGVLIFGAVILMRFIVLTRKQKKTIRTIQEHHALKTAFIQNISMQMEPTLQTLDARQPGVQALHSFALHIQQLSELESSLSEPYEMQEQNMGTFCEGMMMQIQPLVKTGVSLQVNAPKLSIRINAEHLQHILLHLLKNAAMYTPEGGKITLDFKKRGAHTHQFIVSDTGCGIAEEQREQIFKPFAEIKDLTQGDGLGLPICALMAAKMNGELTLDTAYTKGARFVLELHA